MAVSIDNVYQKVKVISNKEQRGYITPLEFNLLANHAQDDIFNQYFYDIGQFKRLPMQLEEYSDTVELIEEKMDIFKVFKNTVVSGDVSDTNSITLETDVYELGNVYNTIGGIDHEVEKVSRKDVVYMQLSKLTQPTLTRPIYITENATKIKVYPTTLTMTNLSYNYIKKPVTVEWGSISGLYDAATTIDFELHTSEENNLVIKILSLVGIMIKDPGVYQIASQEDTKNVQQEKS